MTEQYTASTTYNARGQLSTVKGPGVYYVASGPDNALEVAALLNNAYTLGQLEQSPTDSTVINLLERIAIAQEDMVPRRFNGGGGGGGSPY